MYNTALNFYLIYFHLKDFSLNNFKNEIIGLFNYNLQSTDSYIYNFYLKSTYYIHLFSPNGVVKCRLSFELLSIDDKEGIIEGIYTHLIPYFINYKEELANSLDKVTIEEEKEESSYMGIYISSTKENNINPKDLLLQREVYLRNIKKMHLDLVSPISLVKK